MAEDRNTKARAKQGWPAPFVELRVMRREDAAPGSPRSEGIESPWDGATPGELEIRGPWIASQYYESPDQAHRWTPDGWFRTGDVATIDEEASSKSWIGRKTS